MCYLTIIPVGCLCILCEPSFDFLFRLRIAALSLIETVAGLWKWPLFNHRSRVRPRKTYHNNWVCNATLTRPTDKNETWSEKLKLIMLKAFGWATPKISEVHFSVAKRARGRGSSISRPPEYLTKHEGEHNMLN